jgi:hypothetical protein
MLDLYEEFKRVVETLDRESIPYALMGGLAVAYHAQPRATQDMDFLVLPKDWQHCAATLLLLGFEELGEPLPLAQGTLTLHRLVKIEEGGSDVLMADFLLVDNPTLSEVWNERQAVAWEAMVPLWVVSKSGLIRLKRLRGSKQDLADIEALEGGSP